MVIISPGESWLPTPLAALLIINGWGVVLAEINKATGTVVGAMPGDVDVKVNVPLYDPGCRLCGLTDTLIVPGVEPEDGETENQLSLTDATVKGIEPLAGFVTVIDCAAGTVPPAG